MKVRWLERAKTRRKAVSGIVAAIILFAAIFTTGATLFLFVNSSNQLASQASANAANAQLEASQEKLLIT